MSEPIIVSDEGPDRELPQPGLCNAVACFVEDIGYQQTMYGEKRQIIVGYELDQRITADGDYKDKRFVLSVTYTASLNEKAKLYGHLTSWFGRALTPEETASFDISKLRSKGLTVTVQHVVSKTNGKTYANVTALAPLMQGAEEMKVELEKVPEWVKEKQLAGTTPGFDKPVLGGGKVEEDIPFAPMEMY